MKLIDLYLSNTYITDETMGIRFPVNPKKVKQDIVAI